MNGMCPGLPDAGTPRTSQVIPQDSFGWDGHTWASPYYGLVGDHILSESQFFYCRADSISIRMCLRKFVQNMIYPIESCAWAACTTGHGIQLTQSPFGWSYEDGYPITLTIDSAENDPTGYIFSDVNIAIASN
jgi:hypothetical protein